MKKIVYEEPKMPPTLREALNIDDSRSKRPKQRPSKSSRNQKSNDVRNDRNRPQSKPSKKISRPAQKSQRPTKSQQSQRVQRPSQSRPSQQTQRMSTARPSQNTQRVSTVRPGKNSQRSIDRNRPSSKRTSNRPSQSRAKERPRSTKKKRGNILVTIVYLVSLVFGFIFRGGDSTRYISKEKRERLDGGYRRILSIALMAVILLFSAAIVVHKDQKTSVAENRDLEQKPSFSISSFMDGKYSSNYSSYISDQFPGRAGFVKMKAKFDLMTGKDKINGVYIGKDGYLMEGFEMEDASATKEKAEAIKNFQSKHPSLKTSVMLVPNKIEIYRNMVSSSVPDDSQAEYIKRFTQDVGSKVKVVNVESSLEKAKNNTQLYYKTDHHWTTDGAYIAYQDYCKSANIMPANINTFTKALASESFYGSLYYKNGAEIGSPDSINLYLQQGDLQLVTKYYDTKKKVASLYDVNKLKGRDPYEVFTGGNHSQIKIRTNVESDRKLLVIKDSYANSMLPFLVNNFAEINVVDLRYYTGTIQDILDNNEVTDVLVLYNVNTFNSDSSILNLND